MNLQDYTITHVALNTGSIVVAKRDEFEAMAAMHWPFALEVSAHDGAAIAGIHGPSSGYFQLAMLGVAWDKHGADNLWDLFPKTARGLRVKLNDKVRRPRSLPLCVSVHLPQADLEQREIVRMLPVFERWVARALLDGALLGEEVA